MAITELTMWAKLSTDGDTAGELAHREGKNPRLLLQYTAKRWGHTPIIQVQRTVPPNPLPDPEASDFLPWAELLKIKT